MNRPLDATDLKRLHRQWRHRTTVPLSILLDSVQTPANVGSICRTAAAFGVDRLWLAGSTAPLSAPGAAKVAMGTGRYLRSTSSERVEDALDEIGSEGLHLLALELADSATPLHELALGATPVCIAVGHEDRGLSRAVLARADTVAYVPLVGRVGSLNVAVACAIAVAELRRQQWVSTRDG